MTMEIVNGVVCLNCSDVERAKKAGINGSANAQDPLHPSAVISSKGGAQGASQAGTSGFGPSAIGQSGSSESGSDASGGGAGGSSASNGPPGFGINQPLSSGDRGTQLNLLT